MVSAEYPPVPDSILVSGTFRFDYQIERRFNIDHCTKYRLKLSVTEGKVKLYIGTSRVGSEISGDYDVELKWERAPYVRIVGVDGKNVVRVDAEMLE